MPTEILFSSCRLGRTELRNRVVMAPMTRNRSINNVPGDIAVTYYAQRAGAGLIVTEGTSPSPNGLGYARIPGLFNATHARAWKKVTDAVHGKGGCIFVQLMHTGRASHPDNLPLGARILAPSSIALASDIWVDPGGNQPAGLPEAMTVADIESTIEEYALSSELAIEAGFDGVELHGANGYLIEQFLNTASNQRTDAWGGAVENRIRFAVEIASRTAKRIGGDRLGIRISPYGVFNNMVSDAATEDVFELLARQLSAIGLAYIHVVDHSSMGAPEVKPSVKRKLRDAFGGKIVLAGGFDRESAEAALREKRADLIAFARKFLANPRLVTLLRENKPLHEPDFATFYTPGEKGYTDYPA
jgi:N-ethylmaleimide reductase